MTIRCAAYAWFNRGVRAFPVLLWPQHLYRIRFFPGAPVAVDINRAEQQGFRSVTHAGPEHVERIVANHNGGVPHIGHKQLRSFFKLSETIAGAIKLSGHTD